MVFIGDSLNPPADAVRRSDIEWIGVRHEEGAAKPGELGTEIDKALGVDGPAIVDAVVAADEMPNFPHPSSKGSAITPSQKSTKRCLRSPGHKVSIQFMFQWLPQEEISMIARKLAVVVILGTTSLCWTDAQAHSPYDGSWSVAVYGQSGTCQGGSYQLSLQIVNGNIHYLGGDASVSGRVSSGGAVAVRIETADRSAVGSGRLSRNYGSGTYRGQSPSGACAGTWTGQRTSE